MKVSGEERELYINPIVCLRQWSLIVDPESLYGAHLDSLIYFTMGARRKELPDGRTRWPGSAVLKAICRYHECDEVPGSDCRCGIYAHHDMRPYANNQRGTDLRYPSGKSPRKPICKSSPPEHYPSYHPIVAGVVAVWGKVVLHRDGLRAEYARVLALFDHNIHYAGKRYHVDDRHAPPYAKKMADPEIESALKRMASYHAIPIVPHDALCRTSALRTYAKERDLALAEDIP